MVERVEARFAITPERLIGDMAYGNAPMLAWMVDEKGIEPHVPVWDKTQRQDGTLSSTDFQWDEDANEYRCPEGHSLRIKRRPFKKARTHITKLNSIIYRSSQHDCQHRSEEHTSELQSLMRNSYAVFCLKKKNN